MTTGGAEAMDPEEILDDLLTFDPGLRRVSYYGERSIFFNPGAAAPLGCIFASIKDYDGPNDRAANLSRPNVFRLAMGLEPATFAHLFGAVPPRPLKGEAIALPGFDFTRCNELVPHPVYAWMSWVQILSPARERYASLRPLLDESLGLAKTRWARRRGGGHTPSRSVEHSGEVG